MAPTFPSPQGDSLGISSAKSPQRKMYPSGEPARPAPAPKPHAWHLLSAAKVDIHDVLTLCLSAVDDLPEWSPFVEMQRQQIDAGLAYILEILAAPTLPADPLIDAEDIRDILTKLRLADGKGEADEELLNDARTYLESILAKVGAA